MYYKDLPSQIKSHQNLITTTTDPKQLWRNSYMKESENPHALAARITTQTVLKMHKVKLRLQEKSRHISSIWVRLLDFCLLIMWLPIYSFPVKNCKIFYLFTVRARLCFFMRCTLPTETSCSRTKISGLKSSQKNSTCEESIKISNSNIACNIMLKTPLPHYQY